MTRSSFAWVSSGTLPISSKKMLPLIGEVEQTLLRVDGAGERALHVTEERRLQQIGRQVAGVDGDERALGAGRVGVNGARDQLLARAALALDQNRRPARRRLDDQIEHLAHAAGCWPMMFANL